MTDRAKEAIFSSLGPRVVDADVLDLFAGSGSLGLEALSRGARRVVFVEWRRQAAHVLQKNVDAVGLGGEVRVAAVETHVAREQDDYDLVFVDPPYEMSTADVEDLLVVVDALLREDGVVVVHRRSGSDLVDPVGRLVLEDRRRYGDAEITRFAREVRA